MIGGSEILLVVLAVLLLFGANKMPEMAKTIGKGLRDIKKATDEIKDEIINEPAIKEISNNVKDFKNVVHKNITEINIEKNIEIDTHQTQVFSIPKTTHNPPVEDEEKYR